MTTIIEAGFTGTTYPLNHPRVCWNSTGKRGTAIASSAEPGYSGANALDPMTYNFWKPVALPATFEIQTGSVETISYCGVVAPDIATAGATVTFQVYEGAAWVTKGAVTPTGNGAIVFLCAPVSSSRARISITGATIPAFAVVAFGNALEIPQRVYQGYTPIDLATVTTFSTNMTEGGQFAGRTVQRMGRRNTFQIDHLPEAWVRTNLLGFVEEARTRPFFLCERPDGYPDAVDYVFTEADIQPSRSGPKSYMTVTL